MLLTQLEDIIEKSNSRELFTFVFRIHQIRVEQRTEVVPWRGKFRRLVRADVIYFPRVRMPLLTRLLSPRRERAPSDAGYIDISNHRLQVRMRVRDCPTRRSFHAFRQT